MRSPKGSRKIGQGIAFTNLKYRRVKFPSTLEKIGFRAFQGCKNLDELSFGENLTDILNESFYKCGSLRSVTLPSSLEYLGFDAFHNEDRSAIRVNICSLEWWVGLKGTGSHETPYYFYVDGKELSDGPDDTGRRDGHTQLCFLQHAWNQVRDLP